MAYPYLFMPTAVLDGDFKDKTWSIVDYNGTYAFNRSTSSTATKTLDSGETINFTNNKYKATNISSLASFFTTATNNLYFSGLGTTYNEKIAEMLKNSRLFWGQSTTDSNDLVELEGIIDNVTWASSDYAYIVNFDFTKVSNDIQSQIIAYGSSLRFFYCIGITGGGTSTYTITETLTNITGLSSNPTEVDPDTTFLLQYESNDGYLIDTLTCNIGTVTISSDKTYATITGTATENITVVGTAKKIYTVNLTGTFENCTCNYSDGETVDITKDLVITANSGYEFLSAYSYKRGVVTYNLSKSSDNTTLTCSFEDGYNYTFNDNYNATKQIEKIGTFCNLYNVTNDELTALSKVRFADSESTTIDYGSYITQLYILPLDIPTDVLGDKSTIILGNYDSNVESTLLNSYSCEIDLGTITVEEKYNNVYDYLNTTCTLRLPFFNPIIIDTDNVIGKTITIKLIVDFYSGNVTVNIYSTFTNSIIESQTTNIVTQIPFIQKQNNSIVNQLSNVYKNLIDTAQIEVVRNVPYYTNSIFGKNTIDYDLISNVTGYCEISDIDLTTTATNEEKEQIKTLLKQGVFINEL